MEHSFPNRQYATPGAFFSAYMDRLHHAAGSVDLHSFNEAVLALEECFARGGMLYTCGNGGSAAIANHMTCDILKGSRTGTNLESRIISLSSNIETITAIANDIEYSEVYAYQLNALATEKDVLLTVSSSGNSENIVRAISVAREKGMKAIAFSGFSGGRSRKEADISLHVDENNYGIVEDIHQSLMHALAQTLRIQSMPQENIMKAVF